MTTLIRNIALLAVAAALFTGCSNDKRTYYSTVYHPKTISVVDAVTDQELWTMAVPAGQRLVLDLDAENGGAEGLEFKPRPATHLNWWLYDSDDHKLDEGEQMLPGTDVRIDMILRQAPEYPDGAEPPAGAAHLRNHADETLQLTILPSGDVKMNGRTYTMRAFEDRLSTLAEPQAIVLSAAKSVPLNYVEDVMDACSKQGMTNIALAATR